MKIFDPKLTGSIEFQSPVNFTGSMHGTASWATNVVNGGGGSLSGGEQNYIARWESSNTLTTSSIYEDPTTPSVAIGGVQNFDPTNPETLLVSGSGINVISGKVDIDNYTQLNIQNTFAGTAASSDIVATNDTGDEFGNYVDLGINSSLYSGFLGSPNESYLYNTGSNLLIGNITRGENANVKLFAGNDATVFPLIVTGSQVLITGSMFGTSSWAASSSVNISSSYALSASFAVSASNARSASYAISSSNALSSSYAISASNASTASYVVNALTASFVNNLSQNLSITGSVTISGSAQQELIILGDQHLTGSLFVSNSIVLTPSGSLLVASGSIRALSLTGSLFGTASFVSGSVFTSENRALSSSNAVSASYAISSSNALSSSYAISASNSSTASYVVNALTSSFINNLNQNLSITGSVRISGSAAVELFVLGDQHVTGSLWVSSSVIVTPSGSIVVASGSIRALSITGSLFGTASFVSGSVYTSTNPALSASYAFSSSYAISSSYSISSSYAISASYSITSSYAVTSSNSVSSSYAITSSYAINAFPYSGSSAQITGSLSITGSLALYSALDPDLLGSNTETAYYFVSRSQYNTAVNDIFYRSAGNLWSQDFLQQAVDTGIIYGGIVSFTGSVEDTAPYTTEVRVTPGVALLIDHNAETGSKGETVPTIVNFGPITQSFKDQVTGSQVHYLYIDQAGTLQYQTTIFNTSQYHSEFPLGVIFSLTTESISSYGDLRVTAYGQTQQSGEFVRAFGPLKVNGFDISPISTTLSASIASGKSYRFGGFYTQNPETPSSYNSPAIPTASFVRVYRDPAVLGGYKAQVYDSGLPFKGIDPTKYDDGSGTLQSVGSGEFTIQRLFQGVVNGITYVYYGQNKYTSLTAALNSVTTEDFSESQTSIITLPFIGYIIVEGTATSLADTNTSRIINAGLFRNTAGSSGGGGAAVTNLNDLGDVVIGGAVNGQALIYNTGNWINGNPTSASYASSASYVNGSIFDSNNPVLSSSYALTASYVNSSSYAYTASYVTGSSFNSTNLALSASYAITASYALNGGGGSGVNVQDEGGTPFSATTLNFQGAGVTAADAGGGTATITISGGSGETFPYTGSAIVSGSVRVIESGSTGLEVTGSSRITGSLIVTGSITTDHGFTALSVTASFVSSSQITGSLFGSSSFATTASHALTASYVLNAPSSDPFPYTGSAVISGSLILTGSFRTLASGTEGAAVFGDVNTYLEVFAQNRNAGISASTDIVAYNDQGNKSQYYVDMGINGSGMDPAYTFGRPNDAYVYNTGGDLFIGNSTGFYQPSLTSQSLHLFANAAGIPDVTLSGSRVGIEKSSSLNATLDVNGNTMISGTLFVSGAHYLDLDVKGNSAISGTLFLTSSNSTEYLALWMNGDSEISGTIYITSSRNNTSIESIGDIVISGSIYASASFGPDVLRAVGNTKYTGSFMITSSGVSTERELVVNGEAVVTGSLIVSGSGGFGVFSKGFTLADLTSTFTVTGSYHVWRAPFSCSVVGIWAFKSGSTDPQINARRSGSGASLHLATNLTIANDNQWTSGGSVQNTTYAGGDSLEVIISGSTQYQVSVQVDFIKLQRRT